jgi:hypothetical protein
MRFAFVDGTVETISGKIDREVFLAPHVQAIRGGGGPVRVPSNDCRP